MSSPGGGREPGPGGYGMGSPNRAPRRGNAHLTPGPFPAPPAPRLVFEVKYFNENRSWRERGAREARCSPLLSLLGPSTSVSY